MLALIMFVACDALRESIGNLQEEIGGYKGDETEKTVVVFVGEKRFEITTSRAYLHEVFKDLLEQNKISRYQYSGDEKSPYISAIDILEQDVENGKYYSLWHNVDNFSLKCLDSPYGNPGRASVEEDDEGNKMVVATHHGVRLYYASVGAGALPLVDGCTYAMLVD